MYSDSVQGYFDADADVNALLHTWSLSVEEQFYLFFPAVLAVAYAAGRRRERTRGALATALVCLAVPSFLLCWLATTGKASFLPLGDKAHLFAFYTSPSRAWEFAAGAACAVFGRRLLKGERAALTVGVAGLALIAWSALSFDAATQFPGVAALAPVLGTMAVINAGEGGTSNRLRRAIGCAPAQAIGDVSYSWYLWHWPCIVFARALFPATTGVAVAAGAMSILPAWWMHRALENPIRLVPHPSSRATLRLIAACCVVPLAAAGLARSAGEELAARRPLPEHHLDETVGCDNSTPVGDRDPSRCLWSVPGAEGRAYLLGDSSAGHLSEPFVRAMNDSRLDAVIATKSSCPFIDLIVVRGGVQDDGCRSFVVQSTRDLDLLRPSVVVLAAASDWYIEFPEFALIDPVDDRRASDPEDKAEVWQAALTRTLASMEAQGIHVVLVQPGTRFWGWSPQRCATVRWALSEDSCGITKARSEIDHDRTRAVDAENAAAARTGASVVDPLLLLCPDPVCATFRDGTWMHRDGGHLSIDAALLLTEALGLADQH
jgi:hypothetical protein